MNRVLCELRAQDPDLGRSDEKCERVEGELRIGYVPFHAEIAFSRATGRAHRIHLRLRDPDQWGSATYGLVRRELEARHGPASPVLPLGASFETYCAEQVRDLRRGNAVPQQALVPPRCEEAHRIEGRGGRISLQRCIREVCPGAAGRLSAAAQGVVGLRTLDVEYTAERAPGEPGS